LPVSLDGRSLTLATAVEVAEMGAPVRLATPSLRKMEIFRAVLEKKLSRGEVVYGVNTGFGSLSDKAIRLGSLKELQLNLIRSHAAGVGDPMPEDVVRAAMLIRLNSLLNGNSAVRTEIAKMMADMLNEGVVPYVPEFGSLGASGDLVPSAHMALAMVGEGRCYYKGRLMDSRTALSASKLRPVVLQAKEGLSLINGTCFTTALGCLATSRGKCLLDAGNSAAALTAEVVGACSQSFDERLIGVKLHQGQAVVARRVRTLLKGSQRIRSDPTPQDPYSIRCVPQVHGSVKDALDFAEKITVAEMNSVSDNPLLLEDGTVLHGGNFHAQPVAMSLDLLSLALSYLGLMSLARISLLLSRTPVETKYMASRPGLESGLMILQYTATALASDNSKQIYPVSAYPANVSSGIEDHASHGANAGTKALAVARNVASMLAIELICASNLLGSDEAGISEHSMRVCRRIRAVSPILIGDRSQADEIEALARAITTGKLP
jgi:histidine ammonia-lyase